jgi:diguanylate cyclase (GGDEF)-like protein
LASGPSQELCARLLMVGSEWPLSTLDGILPTEQKVTVMFGPGVQVNPTDFSLKDQLRVTDLELKRRLDLLTLSLEEMAEFVRFKPIIAENIDGLIDEFYQEQVAIYDVARVIGDAESLSRLKTHMRRYILSLFDGRIDAEYVKSRLRIGLVHKRIGVDPKYYVAAVRNLHGRLQDLLLDRQSGCTACGMGLATLQKILLFDLTLVFDTYIHSLVDELHRKKTELEEYATSLENKVAVRTRQLEGLASRDGMTGLYNQRSFYQQLGVELSRSIRKGLELSLIYFDLDHFKQVNDTLGHRAGDEVLIAVAEVAEKIIRAEDIACRYGGDEFVIMLPMTNADDAMVLAKRLLKHGQADDRLRAISFSIGIATTGPDEFLDGDALVKESDRAMYQSKKQQGYAIEVA